LTGTVVPEPPLNTHGAVVTVVDSGTDMAVAVVVTAAPPGVPSAAWWTATPHPAASATIVANPNQTRVMAPILPRQRRQYDAPRVVKGSFLLLGVFVVGGVRQDTDGPRWGKLLVGQHGFPVDEEGGLAAGRRIVLRTTPANWGVSADSGVRPAARTWRSGGAEVVVDLAGDVALEHSDDLFLGLAFFGAPLDVGAGAQVGAHAGDHDVPQRGVGSAVTAGVES
jgi:hypothetical protein